MLLSPRTSHIVLLQAALPDEYLKTFNETFAPYKSKYNSTAISDALSAADHLAIGSRSQLTPNFAVQQLESATQQFEEELNWGFGVNLTEILLPKVSSSLSQHDKIHS